MRRGGEGMAMTRRERMDEANEKRGKGRRKMGEEKKWRKMRRKCMRSWSISWIEREKTEERKRVEKASKIGRKCEETRAGKDREGRRKRGEGRQQSAREPEEEAEKRVKREKSKTEKKKAGENRRRALNHKSESSTQTESKGTLEPTLLVTVVLLHKAFLSVCRLHTSFVWVSGSSISWGKLSFLKCH